MTSNASSGAVPVLLPFKPGTDNPVSGPAYTAVSVTVPAGTLSSTTAVNPAQLSMSDCQSAVINNTANTIPASINMGGVISWKVAAAGIDIVPVYYAGGIIYIGVTLDRVQTQAVTIQIILFTIRQPPASVLSQIEVSGTLNANITNASIPITGNVGITSGSVDANITNANINTQGSVTNDFLLQAPLLTDVTANIVQSSLAFQSVTATAFTNSVSTTWQQSLGARNRRSYLSATAYYTNAGEVFVSPNTTNAVPGVALAAGASQQGLFPGFRGAVYQYSVYGAEGICYQEYIQADFSLSPNTNTFSAAGAANNPFHIGTGVSLTGSGSVAQALPGTRNWSADGWFYFAAAPAAQSTIWMMALPGATTSWLKLYVTPGGQLYIYWSDSFGTNAWMNTGFTFGAWHYYDIVSTSSGFALYLDNNFITKTSTFTPLISKQMSLYIGIESDLATNPNLGMLSELAFWKTPQMPSNQVSFAPPLAPYTGNEAGLFSLYHLSGDMLDYGPGELS